MWFCWIDSKALWYVHERNELQRKQRDLKEVEMGRVVFEFEFKESVGMEESDEEKK